MGRKLLTHVRDVMRGGAEAPRTNIKASITDALLEITSKRMGMTVVIDDSQKVVGIFTDGDLRRLIEKGADLRNFKARDVMHGHPRTIRLDALAVEAAELMEQYRITSILVTDDAGHLCGAINTNDLMRAKVI